MSSLLIGQRPESPLFAVLPLAALDREDTRDWRVSETLIAERVADNPVSPPDRSTICRYVVDVNFGQPLAVRLSLEDARRSHLPASHRTTRSRPERHGAVTE